MTTENECKNCGDNGKCLVSCPECCECGRNLKRDIDGNWNIRARKHNQKTLLIETAAVIAARVERREEGTPSKFTYETDESIAKRAIGIAGHIIEMSLHTFYGKD